MVLTAVESGMAGGSTWPGKIAALPKPVHHPAGEDLVGSIDDIARNHKTTRFAVAGDELEAVVEIAELVLAQGANRLVGGEAQFDEPLDRRIIEHEFEAIVLLKPRRKCGDVGLEHIALLGGVLFQ